MSENKTVNTDPNAKLSFIERFAYGLGDYSGNLIYSSISAFLLVYYVSVLGVNAVTAGSIMAVSKIFDGVSDLIMGRIVDKTHSKMGKARPWLLRLCVPLAVCFVLMFSVPSGLTGKVQVAYMFLTYNLVSTIFYTGVNVPYATLQGLMTTNQYERGLLGNFRNLLATAGTMTVNTFVMKLCIAFGGGEQYSQKGWTLTFLTLGIIFVILNLVTVYFCKERVVGQEAEKGQDAITYGSWLTGVQAMGMGNAAFSFCMKVGSGIGTAALGWILGAGGFNTDPTSPGSLMAINVSCIWIPLATCIIGAVCVFFFDLDQYYDKAVSDLSQGKHKGQ